MTDLTKDEVVKMAREAGAVFDPQWGIASNTGTATFERFATLCRAPLVAENAVEIELRGKAEQGLVEWRKNHQELVHLYQNTLIERDDLKARALKAEQAVEVMAWGMPDALGNIVESISPTEKVTDFKAWAAQYSIPLYATPPSAAPVVEQLVGALEQSKNWHQGDKWRDDSKYRPVWESHMDTLNGAITKGQKFIKENGK